MFDLDLKLMCSCIFVILLSVSAFVLTSSVYSVKGMC